MVRSHTTFKGDPDDQVGWRRIVCNFTPAWFAVNMGTGITSILLFTLPYGAQWLGIIAIIMFCINVLLFIDFLIMNMLRYMLYPSLWVLTVTHPTESMSLGTFPMGLATIINMICLICVPRCGDGVAYFAWALWIFDSVISVLTAIIIPFIMMTRQDSSDLSQMTASWLLPVVSCVVAASSGAVVADVLPDTQTAYWTVFVSYGLWAIGIALALMFMTIYLQRLMLKKGGFGIQKLGIVSQALFPEIEALDEIVGNVFYDLGLFIALLMWAFGLVWLFFAVATVIKTRRFPFNLGWWALTFPLGVFANCTCLMGDELRSDFFWVFGTILSLIVLANRLLVGFLTLKAAIKGDIFVSQCVVERKKKKDARLLSPSSSTI